MSETSAPGVVSPSHVFRPVPVRPVVETASSCDDDGPTTSLSLSLPGVESSEASNRATAMQANPFAIGPVTNVAIPAAEVGMGALNLSAEFMAVMHEMIKKEVRSYMEQQSGMCFQGVDGFRNASVKRIGISRVDS